MAQAATPEILVAKQAEGHPEVRLMSGRGGGTLVAKVANGERVIVLQKEGDNARVRWNDQRNDHEGWIKLKNLAPLSDALVRHPSEGAPSQKFAVGNVVVAKQAENYPEVRLSDKPAGGRGSGVKQIAKVPNGDILTVLEVHAESVKVRWELQDGSKTDGWATAKNLVLKVPEPEASGGQVDLKLLSAMKYVDLKKKARKLGFDDDAINDAEGKEDYKAAVIQMILSKVDPHRGVSDDSRAHTAMAPSSAETGAEPEQCRTTTVPAQEASSPAIPTAVARAPADADRLAGKELDAHTRDVITAYTAYQQSIGEEKEQKLNDLKAKAQGSFTISYDDIPVNASKERNSQEKARLEKGHKVELLQFADEPVDYRVRALIKDPEGWITTWMESGTKTFVVKDS